MADNHRYVRVYDKNTGVWLVGEMDDLKKGHIFVVFEPSGEPVADPRSGCVVFFANENAYIDVMNGKMVTVDANPYNGELRLYESLPRAE